MKFLLIIGLVFLFSCTSNVKTELVVPADSTVIKIIKERYTQENKLDGSEFVTVDTILIKDKSLDADLKSCEVKFYIHCSYQPSSLQIHFEKQRPELKADTMIRFSYNNSKWWVDQK